MIHNMFRVMPVLVTPVRTLHDFGSSFYTPVHPVQPQSRLVPLGDFGTLDIYDRCLLTNILTI